MRLSKSVYLIASGRAGCFLTHSADCNAYAIDCGGTFLLIDSGSGADSNRIFEVLEADGIRRDAIKALLLTHGHLDHAGGACEIAEHLQIPIWASPATAAAIEAGDEEAISLAEAKRAGVYNSSMRLRPCSVSERMNGGDPIRVGETTVRPLATPGHSRDLLSWLIETPDGLMAFTGDTVFHEGRILISNTWDCDPAAYARSLRELSKCPIEGLFPGHSIWSLHEGRDQVAKCLPYLDKLLLPPNLL